MAFDVCNQKVKEAGKEKARINLTGSFGQNLEFLTPYAEKKQVAVITAEFFMTVCSTLKMSTRNALKLRHLLLQIPNLTVEPNLVETLHEKRHQLDDFFAGMNVFETIPNLEQLYT